MRDRDDRLLTARLPAWPRRHYPESFRAIQLRGMAQDLTWDHAAEQYEEVFVDAKYQW